MGVLAASQERSVKLRSAVGAVLSPFYYESAPTGRAESAPLAQVLSPFYYESAPTGRAESLGRRCARNYSKFDTKFDKENDEVFLRNFR